MSNTVNVTVRFDKEVKESAERLYAGFGMTFSTALNIFVRQSLKQGKIPFEIYDPFYSEENQARLALSVANAEEGNVTAHELCEV